MTTKILICDDSSFARRQLARALPQDWDVEVSFAGNGEEGLAGVRDGKGELLLLDLNMPVLDGYQVLETIRAEDLPTLVVVVSGDIQPEAHKRVMQLGALGFIEKPVDVAQLGTLLKDFGLRVESGSHARVESNGTEVNEFDCYREIANVAMGRAADLLARLLGAFVLMPIPNVNRIEATELHMALSQVAEDDTVSAVCQGFIGSGIAGEAMLIFNESSYKDIAELLNYEQDIDASAELELLMDIANVLIGACLTGFADQLGMGFCESHPVVLERHVKVADLIERNGLSWNKTLTIESACSIENRNIKCDLLLLFTEDSLQPLRERAELLGALQ